jgi:HAD superfamily hydrolase (TIGR01549 family)
LVEAVVFDLGETLVDETRVWGEWADALGIPRLTFFAALGALIERDRPHLEVFRLFRPDLDVGAARRERVASGMQDWRFPDDFYPDALDTLRAVRAAGYRVGIAGNQPDGADEALAAAGIDVDLIGSSASWGVQKPDPAFFERIALEFALAPERIAYVGDRLDNDVTPAADAGMVAIHLRRGPWAWIQAGRETTPRAAATIDSLTELPGILGAFG